MKKMLLERFKDHVMLNKFNKKEMENVCITLCWWNTRKNINWMVPYVKGKHNPVLVNRFAELDCSIELV